MFLNLCSAPDRSARLCMYFLRTGDERGQATKIQRSGEGFCAGRGRILDVEEVTKACIHPTPPALLTAWKEHDRSHIRTYEGQTTRSAGRA